MLVTVVMDSPVELGQSNVNERFGRSGRHVFDEAPLPDGELSNLLTRNLTQEEVANFHSRGNYNYLCIFLYFTRSIRLIC